MISIINLIFCKLIYPFVALKGTKVSLSWIKSTKSNTIKIINANFISSRLSVAGNNNKVLFNDCEVLEAIINISGDNNIVQLEKGVKLRKANIIIRGSGCSVIIGSNTTFGGVRIINVGSDNAVSIGSDCLFSDQIEIWASDTHAIYDENGVWINKERPIEIGSRVWVGSRVTILKGVNVSDGAIIGMGSTLTKNVAGKTIAAGYPAKIIRENVGWSLKYPNVK